MSIKSIIFGKAAVEPPTASGNMIRDNIEALTVAILMAFLIKQFAFEAFQVPTESMEPVIIGRPTGGDRIIVNKFVYQVRDPERWEVVVFHYPSNKQMSYVKRCVGMPGEWVFIRNGDLYNAPGELSHDDAVKAMKIVRKPMSVQDEIFGVIKCIPTEERELKTFTSWWEDDLSGKGGNFFVQGDEVVFSGSKAAAVARFSPPFARGKSDRNAVSNIRFDDYGPKADPAALVKRLLGMSGPAQGTAPSPGFDEAVTDMRLSFAVKPESASGAALIEIRDGTMAEPLKLVLAVKGGSEKSTLVHGKTTKAIACTIESASYTDVVVANFDDQLIVSVDGDEVLRYEYEHAPVPPPALVVSQSDEKAPFPYAASETVSPKDAQAAEMKKYQSGEVPPPAMHKPPFENGVAFGFTGGNARVKDVDLARDLFYTVHPHGATDFRVPAEAYLCLGDNSPNSLDGRAFKDSVMVYRDGGKELVLHGDAEAVNEIENVAGDPRPMENPFDGKTKFLDHLGNCRAIDPKNVVDVKTYFSHFVPRDQIVGRAWFVFWPALKWGAIR